MGRICPWRWNQASFNREPHNVIVERTNGTGYVVYKKQRPTIGDLPSKKPKSLFYRPEYNTGNGTTLLTKLFGERGVYSYPKPLELVKDFVRIGAGKGDTILDFFSGSATTAHAVMELNAEDGGKRRCISVQMEESPPQNSPAQKRGFKTIADIGRRRLVLMGKKIRASANGNIFAREVDIGFRYFRWSKKLAEKWPHMPPDADKTKWMRAMETRNKLAKDADPLAMLTDAMLRLGYPLCAAIEETTVNVPVTEKLEKGRMVPCRIFHVTTPDRPRGFRFCPELSVPVRIGRALGMNEDDMLVCREDALDDSAAMTIIRRHRLMVI